MMDLGFGGMLLAFLLAMPVTVFFGSAAGITTWCVLMVIEVIIFTIDDWLKQKENGRTKR